MATPARVRIAGNCKTPSTEISTPSLKVNSPFPRPILSSRVATLPVNDDVAEKRRRRLEAAANAASPTIGTPGKRKDGESGSQWTNAQIAEHYSQCIKLSSENKINAKNAFGLHLIDHMAQMLKSKGDMTNFQVAGCTLDAGAKIYAGRVDAIYNDVYKMLGGFGRANKQSKAKESDDEEQEGELCKTKHAKGKKHHTNGFSSQIVKDVATINTDNYDLEFEVDPLFKKMSAAFDEGGAAGLLINQLRLDSDHCQLMMDGNSKIIADVAPISSVPINISSLRKYVFDMANAKICPTLAGFSLNNDAYQDKWNTSTLLSSTEKSPKSPIQFTAGGEPVQLEYSFDDDNNEIGPADENFNDEFSVINNQGDALNDNFTAASTYSTQPVCTGQQPAIRPELLEQSEYSYFSQAAVEAWAGPQHWKLRPRSNNQGNHEEKTVEKSAIKRKPRKTFSIDFSASLPASKFANVKITSRKLSKSQITKTTVDHTTLPHNECISEKRFLHLFSRSDWIVKRRERRCHIEDEVDAEPLYDYDNPADQENYCPMIMDTGASGDISDDDDGNTIEGNYGSTDTTAIPFVNNTQQLVLNDTCDISSRMLIGHNLVPAPNKIEQIKVNFARQAKRINMQKLKCSMWNIITQKQCDTTGVVQEDLSSVREAEEVSFSGLYAKLPSLLSQTMANEVSIPIAFVSLLHLANEKNLSIINSTDDLAIFTHINSH